MSEQNEPQLTDEELRRLRSILREDDRMRWLWALLRKWAVGIVGTITSIIVFWDQIKKGIQFLIGS